MLLLHADALVGFEGLDGTGLEGTSDCGKHHTHTQCDGSVILRNLFFCDQNVSSLLFFYRRGGGHSLKNWSSSIVQFLLLPQIIFFFLFSLTWIGDNRCSIGS